MDLELGSGVVDRVGKDDLEGMEGAGELAGEPVGNIS